MAAFQITDSGVIDLRDEQLAAFDGLSFATSGSATAQVDSAQFGPGALPLDATITGSSFADTLEIFVSGGAFSAASFVFQSWNAAADRTVFRDTAGDENITGTGQNDRLHVTGGADVIDGGAGNDLLVVGYASHALSFTTVGARFTNLAGTQVDFTNIERFDATFGSGDDMVVLLGGDDTVRGGDGDDTLDGGAGRDVMIGGAGNDTYYVDAYYDQTIEEAGGGIDHIITSISRTLAAHVENLTLAGTSPIFGNGNALANVMTGNSADNYLRGHDGDDTLDGGAGNDVMIGGAGNDLMIGGSGNDTYYVDTYFDQTIEEVGGGIDHVISSISRTMAANIEILTLSGTDNLVGNGNELSNIIRGNGGNNYLRGHDGDDTLNGGNGNDTLDGGAGSDLMNGGAGDDTYFLGVNDGVNEGVDSGTDHVISSITYRLHPNIENLTLTGSGNLIGNGNALVNVIIGNSGNNELRGYEGDDTLDGGAGNDLLEGGAGNDVLRGGVGNDMLNGGDGEDVLEGGAGNDRLQGRDGADTLSGGAGRDFLEPGYADNFRDIIRFLDPSHSTGLEGDRTNYMDLDDEDKFDFGSSVSSVGDMVVEGKLDSATFDEDVAAAVNAGLSSMGAIMFSPSSGDLGWKVLIIVDRDGNGVYDVGLDYVIHMENHTGTLTLDDFI